jgi:hypothetical protein
MKTRPLCVAGLASVMAIGALATAPADAGTIVYPPYVDLNTYLAKFGDANVNGVTVSDVQITGSDANGGFIKRETVWAGSGGGPLYIRKVSDPDPAHAFGLGGPYATSGFVNTELKVLLSPTTVSVLAPTSRPKITQPQKIAAGAEIAGIVLVTVGLTTVSGGAAAGFGVIASQIATHLTTIVKDPADPDYMVLATPGTPPDLTVPDIPGLTEQQIAAWTDLTQTLALWDPLAQAMLDSIDRAQGAYDAGDNFWAAAQFTAFETYYQQDSIYAAAVNTDAATLGLLSGSTAVPEPSTWAMMLIGFAGLAYAAHRRAREPLSVRA